MVEYEIDEESDTVIIRSLDIPLPLFKAMEWYCLMSSTPDMETYIVRCIRNDLDCQANSDWPQVKTYLNVTLKNILQLEA